MPIQDAHDRARAGRKKVKVKKDTPTPGTARGARAPIAPAKKPPTKVVVKKKKKAPPLVVPSLEAVWASPPVPDPKRKSLVYLRPGQFEANKARARRDAESMMDDRRLLRARDEPDRKPVHLPTEFEYVRPELITFRSRATADEERGIKKYNQERERGRRVEARFDKEMVKQRRAEVRALDKKTKDFLGRDALNHYIKEGRQPGGPSLFQIARAVGGGALGAAGHLTADFTSRLTAGLRGRESGREISAGDDPLLHLSGDMLLGPNIIKAMAGEDFNPRWLAVELSLLFVPIKGLPMPLTAALRALVGAQRLARGERAGMTVAEIITRPLLEVRTARRTAMRAEAAAGTRRSSSWAAGKLAGEREGRLAEVIRNDPSAPREFRAGPDDAVMQGDYALSRAGKAAQKIIDRYRARLSKIPGVKTSEAMYAQILRDQAQIATVKYQLLVKQISDSIPRNGLRQVDWPGMYAVRAVLKGLDLPKVITTTERDMEAAARAGEPLKVVALQHHLAYFKAAEKYVGPDGQLSAEAPQAVRDLADAIAEAGDAREAILKNLDLLDDETAKQRVLNEQLYYHTGKLVPQTDEVAQAIKDHPIRKAAEKLFADQNPAMKDHALTVWDANARRHYDDVIEDFDKSIDHLTKSIEHDPEGPMAQVWTVTRANMEDAKAAYPPGGYWDNMNGVYADLPEDVIAEMSNKYGTMDDDWLFAIRDRSHPFEYTPEKVAKNRADKEKLTPLTWKNERNIPEGAGELRAEDIPVVGEITFEEVRARLMLFGREEDARWYEQIQEIMGAVLSDKEIMAWIASQRGQGPAGGIQELWKIIKLVEAGEEIPKQGISKAILAMKAIMENDDPKLSQGARAKISDFFDSALGLETRTWMGHGDPEIYGYPMVIDRWSSRAWGIPESSEAVNLIFKRWGIEVEAVKLDAKQYERIASRYNEFVKWLNDGEGLLGRNDWTHREIQAMDWYATQRFWGREPRSLHETLDIQTYRADFEVVDGIQGLGTDLPLEQRTALTATMQARALSLVDAPGVRLRRFDIDFSGWAEGHNPSMHIELMGTEAEIQPLLTKLAQGFDQELVQASRWVTKNGGDNPSKAALRIFNDALDNPEVKAEFFNKLSARFPELRGYMPAPLGRGHTGIVIRTTRSNLSNLGEKERWAAKYAAGVKEIEAEMGLAPSRVDAENLQLLIGSQHGTASAAAEPGSIGGIARLGDLDPDARRVRKDFIKAIRSPDLRFSVTSEGGVADDAGEAILGARGHDLARNVLGYDEAAAQLARQEIPVDFLRTVTEAQLHIDDKYAIGRALDRLSLDAGGQRLSGRTFPEVPGAERWLPENLVMGGTWDPMSKNMYLSPRSHPVDYIHELMHVNETEGLFPPKLRAEIYSFLGIDPGTVKLTRDQSEDLVDMFEAMIWGFSEDASKLPAPLKKSFLEFQRSMEGDPKRKFLRAQAMLEKMPEELRLRMEDVFWFKSFEGRAGRYVPEVPGLPFSFRDTVLGIARHSVLYNRVRRGQRVTALTITDKALEKSYTGALVKSGYWDRDVTKGPLSGLLKAVEIQKMHRLREGLLATSSELPSSIYDIAIPADPKGFAGESRAELGSMFRLFDVMDGGGTVSAQQLDQITLQGIEQARDFFFPGMSDGTRHAIQEIARRVEATQVPIEGVRWVKRDMLEKVGLFEPTSFATTTRGTKMGSAISTIDFVNNAAKNFTLTWNPAYYPMNMTGMGVMLGSQGFTQPLAMLRSMADLHGLGADAAMIDAFAGGGLTSILRTDQKGVFASITNASSKMSEILIDRYPRRISFLFEARRLGYDTVEKRLALMTDPSHIEDLYKVVRRSRKAMVDFGQMSRFEKEFATRAIFVYPWLRASAKYTMNFPFDHPVQTAMFAGLLYWQQDRMKEAFPDGAPGYLKWYLPLKMAAKEGDTPFGFRMDQMFTPLQTLDLAADITYAIASGKFDMPWGSNEEALMTKMNPLYEEVFKTISGWDAFTQHEVSKGLGDLLKRLIDPRERWATWDRLQRVLDRKTHEGIYDTTQTQNWLRLFLGSLAPVNVDPEAASERAQKTKTITIPDKTDEQTLDDWVTAATRITGGPLPDTIQLTNGSSASPLALKKLSMLHSDIESAYKKEHHIRTGLSARERLIVLIRTQAASNPALSAQAAAYEARAQTLTPEEAEAAIREGRLMMGLTDFDRLDKKLGAARTEARVGATP